MDKSIWVVDDDESIRWVLEKGLEESGMMFKHSIPPIKLLKD
jgi:DNA-binding NtrC family response regulator